MIDKGNLMSKQNLLSSLRGLSPLETLTSDDNHNIARIQTAREDKSPPPVKSEPGSVAGPPPLRQNDC